MLAGRLHLPGIFDALRPHSHACMPTLAFGAPKLSLGVDLFYWLQNRRERRHSLPKLL